MAWLEKRNGKWNVAWREGGKIKRIPGYTDKAATKQLMARLEKARAQGAEGLVDPYAAHKARPLSEHVADYVADLRTLGRDEKYIDNVRKRLAKLIEACGWKLLGDITADSFCRWRERLPKLKDGRTQIGPRTINQYLEVVRGFCGWCVKPGRARMAANPMLAVEKIDETADVRRARRALTAEQLAALLSAVPEHYRAVYRFILATGLRRQEVEDLQWGDVRLDSPTPFLKLRAKATKARRADALPLRADLADELRQLRGDAGDGDKVFSAVPTMDEHKGYLAAARIAYEDAEGRRADVHALRHTYGTLLSKSGVSPREAMELMRHTDLRLTMKVYTDPRIFDLQGAVEKLPIPAVKAPDAIAATGTDAGTSPGSTDRRVANRVATTAILGLSASPAVTKPGQGDGAQLIDLGTTCRELALTDAEGVKAERVGIEPTSARGAG